MRAQVRPYRYFFGIMILLIVGLTGGDVFMTALYMGIAYGIIDYLDYKRKK
tara:strand:+ start:298 stop:450 length:153 start_codon:yes stop_codon:yes gene_type:complete